jgi:hypothetical protein
LRRADHPSKESYQLSISVRSRNLVRGGLGPIWAVSAIGWMDGWINFLCRNRGLICGKGLPAQPPVQWVLEDPSSGVMLSMFETDQSLLVLRMHTSTLPYVFMVWYLSIKHSKNFNFTFIQISCQIVMFCEILLSFLKDFTVRFLYMYFLVKVLIWYLVE